MIVFCVNLDKYETSIYEKMGAVLSTHPLGIISFSFNNADSNVSKDAQYFTPIVVGDIPELNG
jgi:hypothetical protein